MANVNTPPLSPPLKWLNDPDLRSNIKELYFVVYQLYQRSGGGSDSSAVDRALIAANTAKININSDKIDVNASDISLLTFDVVSLTGDYVTNGNEIIITNGYNVTMNASATDGDRSYIKTGNSEITINGNGKLIDGEPSIQTGRPYECLLLAYSSVNDEYFII